MTPALPEAQDPAGADQTAMSTSPADASVPDEVIADPGLTRVLDAARAVYQASGRQARVAVEQQDGTVITLTPAPIREDYGKVPGTAGTSSGPLAVTAQTAPGGRALARVVQEPVDGPQPARTVQVSHPAATPATTASASGTGIAPDGPDPQALERLRAAVVQVGGDLHVTHAADGWIAVAHLPGTGVDLSALSARQREVYDLLLQGLPNRAIARRLALTEGTVRVYVSQVLARLGYASRAQLLAEALACS